MSNQQIPSEEHVKNMLKCLCAMGPASNLLTQFLFILPEKAVTLMKLYPEIMEKEDTFFEILGLRYTEKGFVETVGGVGTYIVYLYNNLYYILTDRSRRAKLLELAKLSEEEFKKFDPLRAWIEVALEFLARVNRDALSLLKIVISLFESGRSSIPLDEVKKEAANSGIKNVDELLNLLYRFKLLRWSYGPINANECPLLIEAYTDLRKKLDELLAK